MTAASFKSLAIRGSTWSILNSVSANALRFVSNIILARLLLQEHFGLMALVSVVLTGLQMFSDIGIGPSIIQNERGDDVRYRRTAWTMQVIRGGALWICTIVLAGPIAWFYSRNDPTAELLVWLLPVAGLTALLSGFFSTKLFLMQRHVNLRRLMLLEFGLLAIQVVVQVTWALISPTVWALVAGGIVHASLKLLCSHILFAGEPDGFAWDRQALSSLIRFGRWIFISTAITFFVMHSDRLIFGSLISMQLLGVYYIALMISTQPSLVLTQLGDRVIFPLYSRIHASGRDLEPLYRRVRWVVLLLAGWMLSGLMAGGPTIVALLYDERFAEAGWMVQWLSFGLWFATLESTNGAAFLARGHAHLVAAANSAKLVGMAAFIPIGYQLAGFPGALSGYVVSDVLKYGASVILAIRGGLRGWHQDLALTGVVALATAAGYSLAVTLETNGVHTVPIAAAIFVIVSMIWAPFGAMQFRSLIHKQDLGMRDAASLPTASEFRSVQ